MEPQIRFKEKSVIIHRDENGFGLRVGGQNPVFVDCVHENGAAWKAGVRKNDHIIKVNGTLVRSFDHQKVVHMIQNCTPFVNLTLHSPDTRTSESYDNVASSALQASNELSGLIGTSNNNLVTTNGMKVQNSINQRSHNLSNANYLLDIGDDLFQDNQQQPQQQLQAQQTINNDLNPATPNIRGVSKLIVSGPSPLIQQQGTSGQKSKFRHQRNQSATRDNPYYYYKTAPQDSTPDNKANCNSINPSSSLLSQDTTSNSRSSLSIARSRSSGKISTRSSTTGKYKARNLRARLVEDLRSLTISNIQTTPSSLSTSPSSSDLSDCDDQDSSRSDCLSTANTSNSSTGLTISVNHANSSHISSTGSYPASKPRLTSTRLEIIRELIDTEKTHTERLKHLNDLLYKPIKAEGLVPPDQLKMVFSCHKTLFKIHRQIYKTLLAAQQSTSEFHQEPLVGRALVRIFEGDLGKRLEKAASTFCACQSINGDLLNRLTRKDTKVGEFLAQVANQQLLSRLGIKDLLASCFQRLTKYPLLLENLLKATPCPEGNMHSKSLSEGSIATAPVVVARNRSPEEEVPNSNETPAKEANENVERATQAQLAEVTTNCNSNKTEDIEDDSNTLNQEHSHDDSKTSNQTAITITIAPSPEPSSPNVTTSEDDFHYERLCISRALYQTRQILWRVNEAVKRAISHNKLRDIWKKTERYQGLPMIDIETEQMLHEGPLTLRLPSRKTFDVYVLLLTHYLVILTREGQEKFKLKYFTNDNKSAPQLSPIFNIDEHLATRDTATDENGFYLLCKKKDDSRIYEFASQSPTERAKWKEKIHMAQVYNFAAAPDDDNTLTRYRDLISLTTSNNSHTLGNQEPGSHNNISAPSQQGAQAALSQALSINQPGSNNNVKLYEAIVTDYSHHHPSHHHHHHHHHELK